MTLLQTCSSPGWTHFSNFQITVIGRYGSTNARAKIPLGFYYGHTYILPWESDLKFINSPLRRENGAASQPDVDQHLTMMVALQEDIQCRYHSAWLWPRILVLGQIHSLLIRDLFGI